MFPRQSSISKLFLPLRLIAVMLPALLFLPALSAQTKPTAQGLLRQMTLQEKVAQLSQLPGLSAPVFKEQVPVSA